MKINLFLLSSFLFLFSGLSEAQNAEIDQRYSYGLIFRSHEVNKDERTSLDLLPDKPMDLSGGFTMEFDLKLSGARHTYGYIFRIILSDTTSIDMMSDIRSGRFSVILNRAGNEKAVSEYRYERSHIENRWVGIKLQIEPARIAYSIDGEQFVIEIRNAPLKESVIEKIYFGANRHKIFYTSDVPRMSVKNVTISNRKGNVVRKWSLGRHNVGEVYDDTDAYRAIVANGIWKIDEHADWRKNMSLVTHQSYPQIATDSINARVFVATGDSLYVLHLRERHIDKLKVESGRPYVGSSSYLIYDYKKEQLVSYDISRPDLITYDFSRNKWSGTSSGATLLIQHHNRYIDPDSDRLVIFGGYGFYRYNADLVTYDLLSGGWNTINLSTRIMPRYLASMGYLNEGKVLVFGGYGSETGAQEASAYNVYDLYMIDTRNNTCDRMGQLDDMPKPYTFSNSMVIDSRHNKFYTLANRSDVYRSSLRLMEVDMSDFEYRLLSDSLPYNFQDTESYSDIFRFKDSCIYAAVLNKIDDAYQINTYSLLYPPLSQTEILQGDSVMQHSGGWRIKGIVTGIIAVVIILFIYALRNRRNGLKVAGVETAPADDAYDRAKQARYLVRDKAHSKISLLGGFQIFDKKGGDITGHFTPVIRQMFLFCLLEYISTGKGVTSERLDEEFWFDMDKSKATNNRNVNIRKLRLMIQEIGDVTIRKDNSYWQVNVGKDTYCDYMAIMALLDEVLDGRINKTPVEYIIQIASAGLLLPNVDKEWVDKYKADYSVRLIDALLKASRHADIKDDLKLLVKLADVIFIHDSLDEDSLLIKCRSLYLLGQKGLSKQCYDKYCADYKNILGEVPRLKYETIITGS